MIDKFLKIKLQKYIDTHFVEIQFARKSFSKSKTLTKAAPKQRVLYEMCSSSIEEPCKKQKSSNIDDFINIVKDKQTFSEYLFSLIDESGESDADIYNRAGIDRRLFSKIRSNADYQPSKNTIFALAMALKLDQTKTSRLLNKAGYEFSNNKLTDIIIMFCIENKIYDLYQIDSFLVEYKQKPIASDV